ncbi:hypothetical protein CERSUDRAFT_99971 [Gelatoporia subvermispora B]|uniref:Uncharacterized protein n=1 Tax=Ceriporiopsis subvermispora (strain B) TaxID=914234 RepID=M2Q5C1_CERS8|nr:hypothetical protein CERSUDRAFT_99971 [Gelatoporia subvermispora B]
MSSASSHIPSVRVTRRQRTSPHPSLRTFLYTPFWAQHIGLFPQVCIPPRELITKPRPVNHRDVAMEDPWVHKIKLNEGDRVDYVDQFDLNTRAFTKSKALPT